MCAKDKKRAGGAFGTLRDMVIFVSFFPAVSQSTDEKPMALELAIPDHLKALRPVRFPGSAENCITPPRLAVFPFLRMKELPSLMQSQMRGSDMITVLHKKCQVRNEREI